ALARMAIDRGALDEAAELVGGAGSARTCEATALVAAARGDVAAAEAAVTRGAALATTAEERARIEGTRGHVLPAAAPARTLAAYAAAADYAARAGAIEDEASYRTGEAAAAVNVGELGAAAASARRAALLWEHFGKPALAARALLAIAAAHASAG